MPPYFRVYFFQIITVRINRQRSFRSRYIKGTNESLSIGKEYQDSQILLKKIQVILDQ